MAKAWNSADATQHWRKVTESLHKKRVKVGIQMEKFVVSNAIGSMYKAAYGTALVSELGACCMVSKAALRYTSDIIGVTCSWGQNPSVPAHVNLPERFLAQMWW